MARLAHLLYLGQQVQAAEAQAASAHGLTLWQLMQAAAEAVWRRLQYHYPNTRRLLVLCGPGNNGGDGYLVAALAKQAGWQVEVVAIAPAKAGTDAELAYQHYCQFALVKYVLPDFDELARFDVVVDALYGVGLKRPLTEPAASWVQTINSLPAAVVAIDLPSGLDSNRCVAQGVCVEADLTLCLVAAKLALFTGDGVHYAGEVEVDFLGVGQWLAEHVAPIAKLSAGKELLSTLPKRAKHLYKHKLGHVLCIGGSQGMVGAIRLSAEAALRSGAGLVTVVTEAGCEGQVLAGRPELMVLGHQHVLVAELIKRADVIVFGPGAGTGGWAQALWPLLLAAPAKKVLDADGLTMLAHAMLQGELTTEELAAQQLLLTPHLGEAKRLLAGDFIEDRVQQATLLQQRYAATVVLKGPGSLIAHPHGVVVNNSGNPGMASAGMGDVLSGILAALLAQGVAMCDAAVLAVYIHGLAADIASEQGQRGLLASDLLPHVRQLLG